MSSVRAGPRISSVFIAERPVVPEFLLLGTQAEDEME
jgi:hypothetical protein